MGHAHNHHICIFPVLYKVCHIFEPFDRFIFPCIICTSTHYHHIVSCQIIYFFSDCVITSKPVPGLHNLSPYDSLVTFIAELLCVSTCMHTCDYVYILICLFSYDLLCSLTQCPSWICSRFSMLHGGYATVYTCNDSM
jgi:hypothetical protein